MKKTTKRFNPALILAGIVAATLAQSAGAADFYLTGQDHLWGTASNWGGTVPTTGSNLHFGDGNQDNTTISFNNIVGGSYATIDLR